MSIRTVWLTYFSKQEKNLPYKKMKSLTFSYSILTRKYSLRECVSDSHFLTLFVEFDCVPSHELELPSSFPISQCVTFYVTPLTLNWNIPPKSDSPSLCLSLSPICRAFVAFVWPIKNKLLWWWHFCDNRKFVEIQKKKTEKQNRK